VEIRLETVVVGVLVGAEHEREDDGSTTHEYESASCGTTCEGVFAFQPSIVGRHRSRGDRGDNRRVETVDDGSGLVKNG